MGWCTSSVSGSCPCSSLPPLKHLNISNIHVGTDLPGRRDEMCGSGGIFGLAPPDQRTPGPVSAPCGRMTRERRPPVDAAHEASQGLTGPDAVLAALDPDQQEVARATRGPVCVLAGAGTGKTRAVAHRIAYAVATGVVRPDRVLAVTFTTTAAGELRAGLRELGSPAVPGAGLEPLQARTFHSAALRQLTYFWPGTVGGPAPAVVESKIGLLAEAARRLRQRLEPAER